MAEGCEVRRGQAFRVPSHKQKQQESKCYLLQRATYKDTLETIYIFALEFTEAEKANERLWESPHSHPYKPGATPYRNSHNTNSVHVGM